MENLCSSPCQSNVCIARTSEVHADVYALNCNTTATQTTLTRNITQTSTRNGKADKNICILQINDISNKHEGLEQLNTLDTLTQYKRQRLTRI